MHSNMGYSKPLLMHFGGAYVKWYARLERRTNGGGENPVHFGVISIFENLELLLATYIYVFYANVQLCGLLFGGGVVVRFLRGL